MSKITSRKTAGKVADVVQCLPSRCEVLSLSPITTKKENSSRKKIAVRVQ
jgi:hypothetical protein